MVLTMRSVLYTLALASFFACGSFAFSVPNTTKRVVARRHGKVAFLTARRVPVVAWSSANEDVSSKTDDAATTIAAAGDSDATASLLGFLVFDAIVATKELALNWGFVLNSGITKIIGGSLAFVLPMLATEVALNAIAVSLAVISAFNIILGFKGQGPDFKLQSFGLGIIQAFLSYRMLFYPFKSLRALTAIVAAACITDGAFETIVSLQNADLPGRWSLFFSGLASIGGGTFVALNIGVSSLFVLGVLLGANLMSSGWSSISAALFGRKIANKYLEEADFEGDAVNTIETVAEAIDI